MWRLLLICFLLLQGYSYSKKVSKDESYTILRAVNLYSKGEKTKALELYKSILKRDKNNVIALRECGVILGQLNDFNGAVSYFNKVLQIEPSDSIALSNLGYIFYRNGDLKQSRRYLEKIPVDLLRAQDRAILAKEYMQEKQYKRAMYYLNGITVDELLKNTEIFKIYLECLDYVYTEREREAILREIEKYISDSDESMIILRDYYQKYNL